MLLSMYLCEVFSIFFNIISHASPLQLIFVSMLHTVDLKSWLLLVRVVTEDADRGKLRKEIRNK
jgi:hypothetical protein